MERVRTCESGGSYSVVSSNGLYHGAYQFGTATWNGLARRVGRTDLVDVLPSLASPADQDALALELGVRVRRTAVAPTCGDLLSS